MFFSNLQIHVQNFEENKVTMFFSGKSFVHYMLLYQRRFALGLCEQIGL
jgi:hypothetical protein